MSRLPRRPLRVKPPLRGRAATKHYRGEFAPVASVRRPLRSYGSTPYLQTRAPLTPPCEEPKPPVIPPEVTDPPLTHPHNKSLYADLIEFYKSWVRLDKPWKWLLTLAVVLSSLLLLNRLL